VLRLELDLAPATVSVARRSATAEVRAAFPALAALDDLVDDVALVVSELVTNAVVHGEPPLVLEVIPREDGVRRTVTIISHDGGPWDGTPPDPVRGRGLAIVRALGQLTVVGGQHSTTVTAVLSR
jgi:anti-sigma regulatory factor (Ser/Thr protein kinase)